MEQCSEIKNTAADAGSRYPVGTATEDNEGIEEMLMGAAGEILRNSIVEDPLGSAYEAGPEDHLLGPKSINGFQLADLH